MKVEMQFLSILALLIFSMCFALIGSVRADNSSGAAPGMQNAQDAGIDKASRCLFNIDSDSLRAGDSVSCSIDLNTQELALFHFDAKGFFGTIGAYGPDGKWVRGRNLGSDQKNAFAFVADTPGKYRIEVKADHDKPVGNFTFAFKRAIQATERVQIENRHERLEGSRIRQLRVELKEGRPAALDKFWHEIEQTGTPLYESDPSDPHLALCTFIWRGDENTHQVRLNLGFPMSLPNDLTFTRIADTNVWFTTVKIRAKGRFYYHLEVNGPNPSPELNKTTDSELLEIYRACIQLDPLNPYRWFEEDGKGSKYEAVSRMVMPGAPPQPWVDKRPNVARGKVTQYPFISKLLGDKRTVSVYTPPGYSPTEKPYGLLLVFDEQQYLSLIPTPAILDNLLADGKVPPLVAILIGNGPGDARPKQLRCNSKFVDFLVNELLPWAHQMYNITSDPKRTVIAGSSLGGFAATYAALQHPEVFGNVLSQSGSYWWHPDEGLDQSDKFSQYREPNYMVSLFLKRPRLPVRFYIDAGSEERDLTGNGANILIPNRTFQNVLLAKGYEVQYSEFIGGHDYLSWRGTLADGLIYLTSPWNARARAH